ncbi:unnamed protein product, partial [marine sediment metagenome]
MKIRSIKLSIEQKKTIWAYFFLFVPLTFYLLIRIYPTFSSFNISFTDWDIVSSEKQFIGLENYQKMVNDPVFLKTLVNTFRYVIFGLPVTLVLSFIIAYNLNKIKRGLGLYRTLYFIPYMTSLVAVSWVWRWLYQPLPLG